MLQTVHILAIAKHVIFEHNTMFSSLVDGLALYHTVNANIRSNIFYGTFAYGTLNTDTLLYANGYPSIITISDVPDTLMEAAGLTEADRTINLTNNVYYTPQQIQDYHTEYDTVVTIKWLNVSTQARFDSTEAYPHFIAENNVEVNPKFADTDMEKWIFDELAQACRQFRLVPFGQIWGTSLSDRNYDRHMGGDEAYRLVSWPLAEGNMEITEGSLLTAGHDGLPVGNLNWNPALKAQYVEPKEITTYVKKDNSQQLPKEYRLSQNYPNPFNPSTIISFSIPTSGLTTLKVFNILGQEVARLVNRELSAGFYKYEFEASQLTSGIYFYKLQSSNYQEVKKMILLR